MSEHAPPPGNSRHLVLLGAGHAHLHVLQALAKDFAQNSPGAGRTSVGSALGEVSVTLVSPHKKQLYSGMVPGFVAGHYQLEQCGIPLEGVLAGSAIRFVQSSAVSLDAQAKTLRLANGSSLKYDWLSLDTGAVMDREKIETGLPGAREHALFVRPIDAFAQLWPQVLSMSRAKPLHLAVIGAGAAGLELAMSAAHAFSANQSTAGCRVSLITGGGPAARGYSKAVQARVSRALQRLQVAVVQDKCTAIGADHLVLGSGAKLDCDAPLLALGAQSPPWLAGSGLSLDDHGFVAVNNFQQTVSHADIFAVGDVASRVESPCSKSGVYAVRAGPSLLANLQAALSGRTLERWQPPRRTLNLLSCGERYAIASWGSASFEGRWVWRWKDWIDRRFVAQYA